MTLRNTDLPNMKSPAPLNTPIFLRALALGTVAALSLTGCKPSEDKPQATLAVAASTNFVPDQPKAASAESKAGLEAPKMEVIEQIVKKATPDQLSWDTLMKATQLPSPPKEWRENQPSKDEIEAFKAGQSAALEKNAGIVREFITANPTHPKITDAKSLEFRFTIGAVQTGREALKDRAIKLADERIAMASIKDEEKFQLELVKAELAIPVADREDIVKSTPVLVKSVKELRTKYPGNEMANQFLLMLASTLEDDGMVKEIAREVLASTKAEPTKAQAEELLKKFERVGKPLDIQFTAVDGRKISIADMKGKVVLIDFWATWCGPCMAELPNVKAAYARLNPKGFEIVGISFDQDKDTLQKTLKKEGMTWPQYFDGEGWQNKFGETFGIKSIPAMWLVDKKGNLRDINARAGLEAKVEKLLGEK